MENKAGQVIRITRSNSLIHKQILNFAARQQGYKPVYVGSLEEAEKFLEDSGRSRALHFHLLQTPVHFSVDGVNETGYVREISTNHCCIAFFASALTVHEEILLTLEFVLRDGSPQSFEIRAIITAIEDECFTAEFIDLKEDRKEMLWKCIVYETQKGS